MKNEKLARAYELGHSNALRFYPFTDKAQRPINPYRLKALHAAYRKGWLDGCDTSLDRLRNEGKCIDVALAAVKLP